MLALRLQHRMLTRWVPCRRCPLAAVVCAAGPSTPSDSDANTSSSRRRPGFRVKRRPGQGAVVRTPLELGRMGQPLTAEQEQLAALYTQLSPEDKVRFNQELDKTELSLLAENLQQYATSHAADGQMSGSPDLDEYERSVSQFGSQKFWDRTLVEPLMLDAVRAKLSARDSALLGKILVQDEATGDLGTGLQGSTLRRQLFKLKPAERKRIPGLLARMDLLADELQMMGEWKGYSDTKVSMRRQRRAAQRGLVLTEDEIEEQPDMTGWEEDAVGSSDAWSGGADAEDRASSGTATSSTSSSASTWGRSFMAARRSPAAGQRRTPAEGPRSGIPPWSQGGSSSIEQIASLMSTVSGRYVNGDGWKEEELDGSEDLQRLKMLLPKLVVLADLSAEEAAGGSGVPPQQYMSELKAAMSELELVIAVGSESADPVVRESIQFLSEHLVNQDEDGNMQLQLEPQTMTRWASFVRAAEVWHLYKPFVLAFAEQQNQFSWQAADEMTAMMEGLTKSGRWWITDAAGVDSGNLQRLDGEQQDSSESGMVDDEKIQALAAVDPLALRCTADLISNKYSDETVMKWSLHPVIGPKLRSGNWFGHMTSDAMPDVVKEAMQQALNTQMEGVDYTYSSARPRR